MGEKEIPLLNFLGQVWNVHAIVNSQGKYIVQLRKGAVAVEMVAQI